MTIWTLFTALLWGVTFIMFPSHANGFWTPKAHLWLLGSFALSSSPWWNRPSRLSMENRWVGFIFLWILLSFGWRLLLPQLLLTQTTETAVKMPWAIDLMLPTLCALGSLLAMDALVRHTDDLIRWERIAHTLCWILSVIALYGLAQWSWLDPLRLRPVYGYVELNAPITTLGNPMLTTNFLAILAPLCLIFRPWRFRVFYALAVIVLCLATSVSSWAALTCGTVTVLWLLRRRRLALSLCGGVVAVGMWCYLRGLWIDVINPHGRLEMWGQLLQIWNHTTPWMGVGLGAMEGAAARGVWHWASAHNEWIQILFETGLIGFALCCGAVLSTLRRLWHTPMSPGLAGWVGSAVAYGVISCLSFPLRIGSLLMIGVCIWAALEAYIGGGYASQNVSA